MTKINNFKRQSIVLKLMFFLFTAGLATWTPFFNLFLKETLGYSGAKIGLITSIQQLNTLFVLPFWGVIADKKGRKKIFLYTLFASLVLIQGFLFIDHFVFFIAYLIVFTFFLNPIVSLLDSMALDFVELTENRVHYGEIRLWSSLGWSFATIFTGYLIKQNLKIIFPISSAYFLIVWVIAVFNYKQLSSKKNLAALKLNQLKSIISSDRRILLFLILLFIYGVLSAPIHLWVNLYYNEINATKQQIGIAFAVQSICELPFFFLARKIIQRFGARHIFISVMIVAALRMIGYSITSNPWVAIAIGASHGVCLALFLVSVMEIIHRMIHSNWRTTGQSLIYTFYFGAGVGLGNLSYGVVIDFISFRKAMGYGGVIICFLTIACLLIFNRIDRMKLNSNL